MYNIRAQIIASFVEKLKTSFYDQYGELNVEASNVMIWAAKLALENISNTDALYHNMEHTIMVSDVGQQILIGKHLIEGKVEPHDWLHFMMGLFFHDIGYVHGVCSADTKTHFATGNGDEILAYNSMGTAAQLNDYHVDRAKLFITERFSYLNNIDADSLINFVEMTRFPIPKDSEFHSQTTTLAGLVRASDLIGQLGDPTYFVKIPALYYEFLETGKNETMRYNSPGELRKNYAKFYWDVVRPFIEPAMKYLKVTQEGQLWLANLHAHVFTSEHM